MSEIVKQKEVIIEGIHSAMKSIIKSKIETACERIGVHKNKALFDISFVKVEDVITYQYRGQDILRFDIKRFEDIYDGETLNSDTNARIGAFSYTN